MPNEKAHGIQIAKTCESFIEQGCTVELVVPNRVHNDVSVTDFYKLRTEIPVTYLPCIDLYNRGRILFFFSSLTFIVSYLAFFLSKVLRGKKFILYSVDMDTFSMTPLVFFPRSFFSELHGARNPNFVTRIFFRFCNGVIAINDAVKEVVVTKFKKHPQILVEPNGVDPQMFENSLSVSEARKTLSIPVDVEIALFVGRFYGWKEVGILVEAAKIAPDVQWYVIGGSRDTFLKVTNLKDIPLNLIICGDKPATEVSSWITAADVVLALGTKKNIASWRFTSPMKIFEYLASDRPIVASRTPAITSILSEKEAYLYEPDDTVDLVAKVREALANQKHDVVQLAKLKAHTHEWSKRAERILNFVSINSIK